MLYFVRFIKERLTLLIVLTMGLGLLKGYYAPMEFSRIICAAAAFFMLYPIMINFKVEEGLHDIKNSRKVLALSLIVNFLISPFLAILIGYLLLFNQSYAAAGLLLIGAVPTSGMAIGWLHQFKANVHMGIVLVAFNILATFVLVPIFTPLALEYVYHSSANINALVIIEKLAFVIAIPMVLGYFTRYLFQFLKKGEFLKKNKEIFGGFSNLGVLIVMFLIMNLKDSQAIITHPVQALLTIPAVALYYLAMYFLVTFVIRNWLRDVEILPFFVATYLRFHIISLGITMSAFSGESGGIFASIPIIVGLLIQPTLASLLGKQLAGRITKNESMEGAQQLPA